MDEPRLFYKMFRTYPSCVHLQDQPDGITLLHHAYEEGKIKAAMMLLEYESNRLTSANALSNAMMINQSI